MYVHQIKMEQHRDFIQALTVMEQLLKSGIEPNDVMLRYMSLIPTHCSMEREMVMLDRWMVRLDIIPSLSYLEGIITASARRLHVEYHKFEHHYNDQRLPLSPRSEFSSYDQDSVDAYPYTHSLNCAPESFFDYYLTDLPKRILFICQCKSCKRQLSGEEIIAGFDNYKQLKECTLNLKKSSNTDKIMELAGLKPSQPAAPQIAANISRPQSKWATVCPFCMSGKLARKKKMMDDNTGLWNLFFFFYC
ncbi:hypothetical protein RFI_24011, partial [Reticulomyxa filosa]